jgi:murein DD-endopeptidase MepM/ murein hydrolase activator NlpD
MRYAGSALSTIATIALFVTAASAEGHGEVSGGVPAPSAALAGGSEYGVETHALSAKPKRPKASRKSRTHRRRPTRRRRPAKKKPQPASPPPQAALPQAAPPQASSLAGVPTPAQTAAAGAVFPVAGPHSFGGPENRFGAPRNGYTHQGQDVLAAEGVPVIAPVAGTIAAASFQEGGAGYYAVEHGDDGFDFMFAHCAAGTLAASEGQRVAAGQALCGIGQTGDATGPHLHFELWVGGWHAPGGYPIDPLPYLEAWDHAGPGG